MLFPQSNAYRYALTLDGVWKFYADKEKKGEREAFYSQFPNDVRDIAVPASWNEQYNDLFNFHGWGWYRREFFVPRGFEGTRVMLRFGAVNTNAKVWVNGVKVCEHIGNSLPFEADITDVVDYKNENTLTVLADSTLDPWSLPPASLEASEGRAGFTNSYPAVTYDFYPYGGIHRSVWLCSVPQNHIKDITVTTNISGTDGIIKFKVAAHGSVTVSAGGISVTVKALNGVANGELVIPNAKLWGIGQPNLYKTEFVLSDGGQVVDCYSLDVGIRTVKIEGDNFLLNGRPVFFKGFGKHEDFFITGKGTNNAVNVKDFYLLDWIGANSFRTSHYPYDEQLLSAADRHGFLVIAETPFVGLNERMYRDDICDKALTVIEEMIARDKNHPSVVMWSLANEPDASSPQAEKFFKRMAECARKLDPSRPITYVAHMEPENNVGYKYYDMVCINKYYGWYLGPGQIDETLDDFRSCIERFRKAFGKPVILSEFGADAIAGMHTDPPQMFSEEFQVEMVTKQYAEIKKLNYCIGAHVWAFADFRANQTTSRIIFNRKGVFTREREPKMLAHVLRRLWKEKED
ncbi:MAG: beta-glucuronidase [Acutalibacteraceae bacterium]